MKRTFKYTKVLCKERWYNVVQLTLFSRVIFKFQKSAGHNVFLQKVGTANLV